MAEQHGGDGNGGNGGRAGAGASDILWAGRPTCLGSCWSRCCRRAKYKVTPDNIEYEIGCCCPRIENVPMISVKDLEVRSCCCGCGTVTVYSADETAPELRLPGIPQARNVYEIIKKAWYATRKGGNVEINI